MANSTGSPGDRPLRGAFSFIDSPAVVESLVSAGFDWVCLDQQHGRHTDPTALSSVAAVTGRSTSVLVRVRCLDAGLVGRALDSGADGVIAPMVESAEEARQLVAYSSYPPRGRRSWGPIRLPYGVEVADSGAMNERVLVAAMIETADALRAVDEIASVVGVSMLFVGPSDLALALGTDFDSLLADPSPDSPLARVVAAAWENSIVAGAFGGTPERATRLEEIGFDYIAVSSDTAVLQEGASSVLSQVDRGRQTHVDGSATGGGNCGSDDGPSATAVRSGPRKERTCQSNR